MDVVLSGPVSPLHRAAEDINERSNQPRFALDNRPLVAHACVL